MHTHHVSAEIFTSYRCKQQIFVCLCGVGRDWILGLTLARHVHFIFGPRKYICMCVWGDVGWELHLAVLRSYSWFCTQGSHLVWLGRPHDRDWAWVNPMQGKHLICWAISLMLWILTGGMNKWISICGLCTKRSDKDQSGDTMYSRGSVSANGTASPAMINNSGHQNKESRVIGKWLEIRVAGGIRLKVWFSELGSSVNQRCSPGNLEKCTFLSISGLLE